MDTSNRRHRVVNPPTPTHIIASARSTSSILGRRSRASDFVSGPQVDITAPSGSRPKSRQQTGKNKVIVVVDVSDDDTSITVEHEQGVGKKNTMTSTELEQATPVAPFYNNGSTTCRNRADKGKARDGQEKKKVSDSNQASRRNKETPSSVSKRDVNSPCPPADEWAATAQVIHLHKEVESLKKTLHDQKKAVKKQNKLIESMKAKVEESARDKQERDAQIQSLKSDLEKHRELISIIETTTQCQICIELMAKPYALSPCGHILCLSCLQQWFRTAPPSDDDMEMNEDETDEEYLIRRDKSCPCCRAIVQHRPVPVFMVKNVTLALKSAKRDPGLNTSTSASPPPDTAIDPWKGLFLSLEDEDRRDINEDSEDGYDDPGYYDEEDFILSGAQYEHDSPYGIEGDSDEDDDVPWATTERAFASASDSDTDPSQYVPPQWEPPTVDIDPAEYMDSDVIEWVGNDAEVLSMLRRGCTPDMIMRYHMQYSHDEGLIALMPPNDVGDDFEDDVEAWNKVYLGWNISLSMGDDNGSEYMEFITRDIHEHPCKWTVTTRGCLPDVWDGEEPWDARRLVREEEVVEYDSTDTEGWLDDS